MTNDLTQRNDLAIGEAVSRRAWRTKRAGVWRRRRLVFDFLETRRLLSTNVAEFPIRVEGGQPEAVASGAGSDQNVWFTLSSNNIGMINPNDTAAGITQYPIPTDNSGDGPIAAGPDGNYWFFEETANQFGVISPSTGKITEIPLLSSSSAQVDGITAGPNGYLWFTANGTSQIGEINTTNDQVTLFPTKTPRAEPYGIVEGPDGNMWFTEAGANQIGMINPTTHAMQEFPIDSSGNDNAEGIAVGPDGNLWLTLAGTDEIAVMSPSNGALLHEYSVKPANAEPNSITVGPDGNLWFTESAADNVGTITTAGSVTAFSTGFKPVGITSRSGGDLWFVMTAPANDTASENEKINSISPSSHAISSYDYTETSADNADGIVADSNGNLWFTQESDNQVGEFNPTTGITTEYTTPTAFSGPLGIAPGPNGDIYFTEYGYDHGSVGGVFKIGVVDPSNGTIEEYATPTARSEPYGIVDDPVGGDLWFTEEAGDKIGQFDPETHSISEISIPTANSEPEAITVDSSGNIWFTEFKADQIGVLNPNGGSIQSLPVAYAPEGIAFDSSGNVWVSEENTTSGLYYLGEYDASNGALIKQYGLPSGHNAHALTLGPDGDIWFADSKGNIGTITSSGTFTFYPTTNAGPVGITSPSDGNIWFTATGTQIPGGGSYPNVIGVVTLSSMSNPTQLAVTTQPPGSVTATDGFGLVVTVENSAGDPDIDYTGTVAIALGNDPGGDTLKGTLTADVYEGVAVFSGLTLKVPDSGYTITATASGLSSTTTDEFNVSLGATELAVTSGPPDSVQAGTTFSITVSAEDGEGNVDTTYNSPITLTLGNANGATLSGVLVVGANDGVATFTGLSVNQPGDDYVILASGSNLNSATSDGFKVTVGPAYQLVVQSGEEPPSSVVAGAGFALSIEAEDKFGDEATSFAGSVTLSIYNNAGVQLQGNLTLNASNGLVMFPGLSIDTAGSFTIEATSTGLVSAITSVVNVSAGQAVKLVVTPANEPPGTIAAGGKFGFVVDAEDGFNNIDPTYDKTVTIAASPAASLNVTPSATAQSGVATFSGLSIDPVGVYTIQAKSGSLFDTTTTSISVTPGSLFRLEVTSEPPSPITAAATFGLSIGAADQYGNSISNFGGTVLIALVNSPGVTLYGTLLQTGQSGVAAFSDLSITKAGSYQIQATSGSLQSATTSTFTVSAAGADQLVFEQQPSNTIAGTAMSPVTVQVEDASGNPVTTDNTTVTVTLSGGTFADGSKTDTAMAVDGVATFSSLIVDAAGNFTLAATDQSLTAATSSSFTVNPATASYFVVTSTLSSPDVAGTLGNVAVTAYDAYNNPVSSGPDQYEGTVDLSSSDALVSGLPSSYLFIAADDGSHTFDGVALKTAGSQLMAATDSVNHIITGSFAVTVAAATASKFSINVPPNSNVVAGNPLNDRIVIDEEDQYGNIVATDSSTRVTASLQSGSGTLTGTRTATVENGVASFDDLEDDTAGAISLEFTAPGVAAAISGPITVSAGPAAVIKVVGKPPSGVIAGISFGGFVVEVMDNYNNVETSFTGQVTAALASGSMGTLGGTPTVNAVSGIATFSDLVADTSGSISLTANGSASGTTLTSPPPVPVVVSPAPADQFVVTTTFASPDVAGSVGTVTITALDQFGNVAASGQNQYLGTVKLSTTDLLATGMPASYGFTAGDAGSHTFTEVLLARAGSQTITATDSANHATDGTSIAVDVVPGAVNDFVVTTSFANPDVAGTVGTVTVTAKDPYGNTVGSGTNQYLGTVDLSGTDDQASGLPATHAFVAGDAGSFSFTGVVLKTAGTQTITATDSVDGTVTGDIKIKVVAAAAQDLVLTTTFATTDVAGTTGTVTISAFDAYNNLVSSGRNLYEGTVELVDTDGLATGLPASFAFTAADAGSQSFSNVVLKTAGSQTITASDTVLTSLTDTATVSVVPAVVNDFVLTTSFANPDVAGTVGTVTVTAKDPYGNTVGSGTNQYLGTIDLSGTDDQASGLPATHAFVAGDAGSFSFTGVVLKTAGTQTIMATDSVDGAVTGEVEINVVAAAAQDLVLTTSFATTNVAGTTGTVTISAFDAYNNLVSSGPNVYAGTVDLGDSDDLATGLPPSHTFTEGDAGSHTFSNVVLKTAGSQSITATDTVSSVLTDTAAVNVVPAAVKDFVVTTSFANLDVAGTLGTVTVTAKDMYGNTVRSGQNQYIGTVDLKGTDDGAAGLPASHAFTATDAGAYTFTGVVLKTADSQTITATDSVNSSIVNSAVVTVTAAAAADLVVTTPPPSPLVAGQDFTMVVTAEDPYHNIDTSFSGNVTISLPGDSGLTTTMQAKNGVATFGGLSIATVGQVGRIEVTSVSLSAGMTSPITVTAQSSGGSGPPGGSGSPTPMIESDQVATTQKLKKGKKVGKAIFSGFRFQFNMPVSISAATLSVYSTTTKRVKKKTVTTEKAVSFTPSYDPSTNTVFLTLKTSTPFAKSGGEITISGVKSQGGALQSPGEAQFVIARNAKGITET